MRRGAVIGICFASAIICAGAFVFVLWVAAAANKSSDANCEVVAVLLGNRADRKQTIKLFAPIRRANPAQFDKLVARAEAGDRRLEAVRKDLACDIKPVKVKNTDRRKAKTVTLVLEDKGGDRTKPPNGGNQPVSPPSNPGGGGDQKPGVRVDAPPIQVPLPDITVDPPNVGTP